ncbi:HK97 gp10 family phage protein [Methylocaldum gracile subsp. desertum]|uniref:HK97 gp10 family phage protein n=1 Tax=Methylocaldum sp. GT1BW TaxID=3438964 RepID=UPI003DA0E04E
MEIAIDLGGFAEFQALWRRAPELADRELHAAMEESLALLQRETVEATPTGAHGLLRKSIVAREPQRLSDGLLGVVDVEDAKSKYGSVLNYAVAVELGTKPHFPPIEPLIDWVKAKLPIGQVSSINTRRVLKRKSLDEEAHRVAFLVARKIASRGTEGAHMFERTMAAQRAQVQTIFDRAMRRIVEQLGG